MKTFCFLLIFALFSSLISKEITKTLDYDYVRAFEMSGNGKVEIKQTGKNRLTLQGEEVLLDNLLLTNHRGILSASPKDPNIFRHYPKGVAAVLEVDHLSKITLKGDISLDIDQLKEKELSIYGSGHSVIEALLDLDLFLIKMEGGMKGEIKGQAKEQSVFISGSGTYNGEGLKTEETTVNIQGSGTTYVNATEKLTAFIAGHGHVYYTGNPKTISKKIHGEGEVSAYGSSQSR